MLKVMLLGWLSTAISIAYTIINIGEVRPELSGNGQLLKSDDDDILKYAKKKKDGPVELSTMIVAGILALTLYLFGVYINSVIGLPAPIVMLLAAVISKALGIIPKSIEEGGHAIFRFTVTGITVPLLLGVGVAMTPWKNLVAVITNPACLVTIFCTVLTVVVVEFFVGKMLNMNPVESAMVTSCNSGQGGTGDVAILTAGNRLELMPFAQVATRLGGAATVTWAIFLMRMLH
ncbi:MULTISPECIES: 2-hydroxycarboxylate transporter family protein [Clostridium]|uniref:Citrate:cation symporter n=3 Tax=Clostridium TaxID=1485 RepID=A0A3M0SC21_9CLOT|nr:MULTISPECIES: 2-hydroxycarboxylate transporter family protein [Clostridium]ADK15588.1 predicted citrate:cation symporter [Clostridium ljungdahlii DSM 13528]AGY74828.2 2-hydroxycarboxylate transporter family protein [Clostridium autoethanogenum DSM 10061]RMC92167.1 citrate:cation symporter [Clostridium autoethanogenum]